MFLQIFLKKTTVIPRSVQSRKDVVRHSKHLQYLISRSWVVFLKEYINDLNMYKKKMYPHRKLVEKDLVLYSGRGERQPINQYQVCVVKEIHGRGEDQRSLTVETVKGDKKGTFTRPTDQFCLFEISDFDVKNELLTTPEQADDFEIDNELLSS